MPGLFFPQKPPFFRGVFACWRFWLGWRRIGTVPETRF